jgi:murein DD-endopeptidase MepM/ murein hydrolase activator NlpD
MGIYTIVKFSVALSASAVVSGCQNGIDLSRISSPFQRQSDALPSIDRPAADGRGVITYETYQVIVVQEGDSLASIASRVGITATELADTNGLPVRHIAQTGEVLVLPENVGGRLVASPSGWSAEIATTAIENATPGNRTPEVGSPTDPLRHRVEAGQTAHQIARQYNVSLTALSRWNGLDSEFTVRTGQQLIIPVADTDNIAPPPAATPSPTPAPAPAHNDTTPAPEVVAPVPAPVPAPAPVPVPAPAPVGNPNAPFIAPVEGQITRGYQPNGRNKNEGFDYTTTPNARVRAVDEGVVVVVSESLGDLGTIVLIRHSNDLLTVYGRVSNVTVNKGDTVTQGQVIGSVATATPPTLHFEVRVGTQSVDPTRYMR